MTRSTRGERAAQKLATSRRLSPTTALARSSMPIDDEPVGEEERVGVEPGRAEELAADGEHFGGAKRSPGVGSHAIQAGSSHIRSRSVRFA